MALRSRTKCDGGADGNSQFIHPVIRLQQTQRHMVYIYYQVTSIPDFKEKLKVYFEDGKKFGLDKIVQSRDQSELFMEIVTDDSNVDESLRELSDLRARQGIDKLILNNKIHVEVFHVLLGSSKQGQQNQP